MSEKKLGKQTVRFAAPPTIAGHANAVGKKESQGPLKSSFDIITDDPYFGQKTWEKAESEMQRLALDLAIKKSGQPQEKIECIFGGDLLNQCIGTSFNLRSFGIPFYGLYGACSTMAESLALAAMTVDGGFADTVAAITSSHFCSAEKQYRQPLSYGGQRTPTAQWTATAAGAVVLTANGEGPYVTMHTVGTIEDMGITDANNMGAAMAPAAYATLTALFNDTSTSPSDYDLIVTGDLGSLGGSILCDMFKMDGIDIREQYADCGMMIYDAKKQDVHAGGSGCGCSAAVLTGYLLNGMRENRWTTIVFAGTGALLSPTSTQQGETVPGICHAVVISRNRGQ